MKNTFKVALVLILMILFPSCENNDGDKINFTPVKFNPEVVYGDLTDQDGNTYKTVTIGTQVWMAENLKTTKYRNGDIIPVVNDVEQWKNKTSGAYCRYDNNSDIAKVYGFLYNWYAVNDPRNIAPEGWHVPSIEEWAVLSAYVRNGGYSVGLALKESGNEHWKYLEYSDSTANESGFTALPGGIRNREGFIGIETSYEYRNIEVIGNWWSSSRYEDDSYKAMFFNLGEGYYDYKDSGLSIRCVKDNDTKTVPDIDGNLYHTVTIGTQVWMTENLKTTRWRNGLIIYNLADPYDWYTYATSSYCDYNNLPANSKTYGRLYTWYAVNSRANLCPPGWHVPSDSEWTTLIEYLGGETIAGGKMKETGTDHWATPNIDGSNESGFFALPGGQRLSSSVFQLLGESGFWWSSTEVTSTDNAYFRSINYSSGNIVRNQNNKKGGRSVRCIKD